MSSVKVVDTKQFCEMAINNVAQIISLKFPQYLQIGSIFKTQCMEEAFEEIDILIDDFSDGFDESVLLESISENTEIKDNDKESLCNIMHYALSTFSCPPTSLHLAEINTNVENEELLSMNNLVVEQAMLLKPDQSKDKALLKVLVIGQNNGFPLLIYLIDTYVRCRLLEYQKLYKQLNQKYAEKNRRYFVGRNFQKVMEYDEFFKRCNMMEEIKKHLKKQKYSQYKHILSCYEYSMKSFFRRICAPLKMTPQQILYKINDSMLIYAKYYIALLIAVNNILQTSFTKLPLQIDFWIIPKAMAESNEFKDNDDDDDDDKDDDDWDDTPEGINNLDERLKFTDNLVVKDIEDKEIDKLSTMFAKIYEEVVKRERSKRMVIIIDRRINGEDIIKNTAVIQQRQSDKLYAFLPKNSQNIPRGNYLHESMFNLSRTEVLPSENGQIKHDEEHNAIHAATSSLLNMCLLSIHAHREDVVRAYWNINGSSTRFYVNDMVNVWPLYFIEKENDQKQMQDVDPIIDLIQKHSNSLALNDDHFDTFFEQNTKINPLKAYAKNIEKKR